jgi:hypothetical protein
VDPRAGLDDVGKRKDSDFDPSVVQPVASRYTDCAPLDVGRRIMWIGFIRLRIGISCGVLSTRQ